jgi:hypothetical protein
MHASSIVAAAVVVAALAAPSQVSATPLDTFEDGTAMGWFFGGGPFGVPAQPHENVATGGPLGANDNYLQLTSTGSPGPRGRLTGTNGSQWSGDYLAAGITSITMDASNLGINDLFLRLAFEEIGALGPVNIAYTNAVFLPAGSGWTPIAFSLLPGDLTAFLGNVNGALTNSTFVRLYHSEEPNAPNPLAPIPLIPAVLGVDNIGTQNGATPAPVPEPATLSLLLSGAVLGLWRGRTRRG